MSKLFLHGGMCSFILHCTIYKKHRKDYLNLDIAYGLLFYYTLVAFTMVFIGDTMARKSNGQATNLVLRQALSLIWVILMLVLTNAVYFENTLSKMAFLARKLNLEQLKRIYFQRQRVTEEQKYAEKFIHFYQIGDTMFTFEGKNRKMRLKAAKYAVQRDSQDEKESDSGGMCTICYSKEADTVLMPCCHGGVCAGCALALKVDNEIGKRKCLYCRKVSLFFEIFFHWPQELNGAFEYVRLGQFTFMFKRKLRFGYS